MFFPLLRLWRRPVLICCPMCYVNTFTICLNTSPDFIPIARYGCNTIAFFPLKSAYGKK